MAKKIKDEDGKVYAERKPIYKRWWFILIAIFVILGAISNITGGDSKQETNQKTETVEKVEEKIEYEKVSAKELIETLEGNALKASEKYKDKYVEITGVLGNIDAQGNYFSIDPSRDSFILTGIQAYITNDTQKNVILDLSKGEKIIVKGKIKDVGEVLGYSVDIIEVSKGE